jgi:hypothetical protein
MLFRTSNTTLEPPPARGLLDRAGICLSLVCLVQCLLLSVTLVFAPFISLGIFGSEAFHRLLLALIVPLGLVAFASGFRRHRSLPLLAAGLVGLALVVTAAMFEGGALSPLAASGVTSLGGLLLVLGHWFNLRKRRMPEFPRRAAAMAASALRGS